MSKHTFTGPDRQVYPQYLDVEKESTLVAEPGGSYEIAQAIGSAVPGDLDENGNATLVDVVLPIPPDDGQWRKPGASKRGATEGEAS